MMSCASKYRVTVETLRPMVTTDEVVDLFKPLEIRDVVLSHHGGRYMATVTLTSDRDIKIACLRDNTMYAGYRMYVNGSSRHVKPVKYDSYTQALVKNHTEGPKNLYVLNIPLFVSITQLQKLFEKYGTVQHCVILSMLDGHARKRGFVDMSSAKEAQNAVQAIHGYNWHGYTMEVSYARVQRGSAADVSRYNTTPSSHLVIRGLLPYATVDKQDIMDMISPYASVLHVTIPELKRNLQDTYSASVALNGVHEAERVMDALNEQIVVGQHLQVHFGDPS